MRYFIVNQKDTFKEECEGGYIWAPKLNEAGRKERHWETMLKVKQGDIIISNKDGFIISVNIALGKCYDNKKPFESKVWRQDGRRIDLEYRKLKKPFRYNQFLVELIQLQGEHGGAFNRRCVNQGYLFQLTIGQFKLLMSKIEEEQLKDIEKKVLDEDSLDLDDILEERKQQESVDTGKEKAYSDKELSKLYEERKHEKPVEKLKTSKRINTDARLKATCLRNHNYLCEVDPNHKTFMNTKDEHEYMESHHFIPVKAQIDFPDIWLDDLFNLVCLCPTCHAQFHYGSKEAKTKVFNRIYQLRKQELLDKGIDEDKIKEIFSEYYF